MRLNPENLQVQSFSTSDPAIGVIAPSDTGPDGPDSLCWICYDTGNYVPSCKGYKCEPDTGPDGPDSICWICYDTGNYVPSCNFYKC